MLPSAGEFPLLTEAARLVKTRRLYFDQLEDKVGFAVFFLSDLTNKLEKVIVFGPKTRGPVRESRRLD